MTSLATVVPDCWNQIGVGGDQSCPELVKHIHCRNCPVFATAAQSLFDRQLPEEYVAEWTAALARAEQGAEYEFVSVGIFRLGEEWLALPVSCLAEVCLIRSIHRVPHRTNRFFKGLVNIRGQLHLCVSLRGVLGIEGLDSDGRGPVPDGASNGETDHGMLVVAERRGERWVFIVDEMASVERIPRKELRKVPGTLANPLSGYSQAVFIWRNRHVGFLDEERLLTAFGSLGQ